MDNKYVNKALELSSKVASNVYLDAISKGLMGTLPILIIGSIGCLLGVFPFDPYLQFIEKIGVKTYFLAASTVTTSCLSIYAAFLIGYRLAGSFKCDQIPAGLISVFAFFITTPLTKDSGLMMEFMGAKGLFGAMIAALIATRIYCAFMNVDKLKIKMPNGVPPMIANTFTALIPAILVGLFFIAVATIFSFTPYGSFTQLVYTVIVTPLNSLGGSVWSLVVLILVQMFLWFFGIYFKDEKFDGDLIYTGAIDELFDCRYGRLPYRSLDFKFEHLNQDSFQDHSVVNYTVSEDYTRITEFKFLTGQKDTNGTTIVKEYPFAYTGAEGEIPYYAILEEKNQQLYEKYKALTEQFTNFHLLGRLAEYKYYNIDAMCRKAMELAEEL